MRLQKNPGSAKALESIRDVIRQKWEQEQQAKSDDSHVRFLCPMCNQKLSVDLNELLKIYEARRSSVFGRTTCPSCDQTIKLPRSVIARVRRMSSLRDRQG